MLSVIRVLGIWGLSSLSVLVFSSSSLSFQEAVFTARNRRAPSVGWHGWRNFFTDLLGCPSVKLPDEHFSPMGIGPHPKA